MSPLHNSFKDRSFCTIPLDSFSSVVISRACDDPALPECSRATLKFSLICLHIAIAGTSNERFILRVLIIGL